MPEEAKPVSPVKDFYCIEITTPIDNEPKVRFEILLSKKSLVRKGNMAVTSMELKNFLHNTELGTDLKQRIDKAGSGLRMGSIHAHIAPNPIAPFVRYTYFFPMDKTAYFGKEYPISFEYILKGKDLGTMIEAHLFKYFKRRLPNLKKISIFYSDGTGILLPRQSQLRKIRGGKSPFLAGELNGDYELLKSYLKRRRATKHRLERWRITAQKNKRLRLRKAGKTGR